MFKVKSNFCRGFLLALLLCLDLCICDLDSEIQLGQDIDAAVEQRPSEPYEDDDHSGPTSSYDFTDTSDGEEPRDAMDGSPPQNDSLGETNDSAEEVSEAQKLYEEGMKVLNESNVPTSMRKIAFKFFDEAAQQGHVQAREWVALGHLLGWGSSQSLSDAHAEFTQLAIEGNPRGQFGLGLMYASGLFVNASVPHALIYYTFAALGGDELAEMALGYRHWTGTGLEESCESALTYYYRVAKKVVNLIAEESVVGGTTMLGPLVRRVRLLEEAEEGPGLLNVLFGFETTHDEAVLNGVTINEDLFHYYQFMADKRNSSAQVVLGQFYYYGRHGAEKDLKKAYYYFSMAAESGSSLAKAFLGEMYLTDNDAVQADPTKALSYLRQSAEEDNPVGQTALAMIYLHGKADVPVNPLKAMELLLKAADHGWADAQLTLGRIFMGTYGMKPDHKLALKYFMMASQQGNTQAFFYLGEMHATGVGVLRSCTTATELFKNVAERGRWSKWLMYAHAAYRAHRYDEAFVTYLLLAELGLEVAQSNVAFMLEEGKVSIVPRSEFASRAFVQWQRSATQGSTTSRVKLGDCYYYGLGTDVDYAKAVQHYRIASEMHQNSQAMFNLAYMHEQGLGLKRDIHLAKRYYDLAAETSLDAKIPAQLALIKLSVAFGSEYLHEFSVVKYLTRMFGGNSDPEFSDPKDVMDWDFYVIPLLAGVLLALIFYIRNAAPPRPH